MRLSSDAQKSANQNLLKSRRMLNAPGEKLATRLQALEAIEAKLTALNKQNILKDEATMKKVLGEIAQVQKLAGEINGDKKAAKARDPTAAEQKQLDTLFAAIKKDVEVLKQELMDRAKQLQEKMEAQPQQVDTILSKGEAQVKLLGEKAFNELLDVQDAPLDEQLKVVEKYRGRLPAADALLAADSLADLKKAEQEGKDANLAFVFGQNLDNAKLLNKKKLMEAKTAKLEKDAHINKKQAESIMPILLNLEKQQMRKHDLLRALDFKIHKIDATERFYKKQRASYAREEKILEGAVGAIEKGDVKKVQEAMKKLGEVNMQDAF